MLSCFSHKILHSSEVWNHLASPSLSSVFYSSLHNRWPIRYSSSSPTDFLLPTFNENKACNPFYLHSAAVSIFFFLKIICQHCFLSFTQWNKQCLLNWQFWLFAACDFSKAWQLLAWRHGKPFQIRKSVKRKAFQGTEVVTAGVEWNKSPMY